ncbi:MAG: 50S ribosomal protein L21 [Alphaproteobacteria bacterium]
MFAVIKTGGKQYKVAPGDLVTVEKLAGDAGKAVDFAEVLMVGEGDKIEVGKPFVSGAKVSAEVAEQARGPKIVVFKKRRRQNSRRKNGHRQDLTVLRITEIAGLGKVARAESASAATEAQPKKRTRKKAAEGEALAAETKE